MAIPASHDATANSIDDFDELSSKSAESAGSTHPAIFSLLPAGKSATKASLTHDEDTEFWILNVTAVGVDGRKEVKVPVRLVAIGESEI